MSKTFFIFSASPKEKYYWLREPYLYQNLGEFTIIEDFTWRVSDCEELVGVTHRRKDVACWWRWRESNPLHQMVYNYIIL
jgi:hypothetical protein